MLLSYIPLHLEAQQRLQEEGCVVDITVSFVLPNHKQFIRVNCTPYIAHAFIWLPISFLLPHRKQLIELNHMPFIAHATKT